MLQYERFDEHNLAVDLKSLMDLKFCIVEN